MSKVININTHKDYKPVYRGLVGYVSDKQKIMNMQLKDICDKAYTANQKQKDNEKSITEFFERDDLCGK